MVRTTASSIPAITAANSSSRCGRPSRAEKSGKARSGTAPKMEPLLGQHDDRSISRSKRQSPTNTCPSAMKSRKRKHAEEQLGSTPIDSERSNQELQDFASIAAHDLQEPLSKVQAFGDRLSHEISETVLGDEGRDYLDRMLSSAKRMRSLIDDLLTYSRGDHAKLSPLSRLI